MATNTTSRTLALAAVGLMVAATTAACGSSSTGSSSTGSSSFNAVTVAEAGLIGGLDYGPLVGLIGTWKSDPNGPGLDTAPGQAGSTVGQLSLIHISEPTRRTPISYAVFCLKK